jgi:poly(hydroxyalkanoate) granule-associated protein
MRNAWWAGLGLVAAAREVGVEVFDALVEEGKSWEQARRERREETAHQVQQMVGESDAVEAVEDRMRDEVNEALRRVGVPHRDEVDALRTQIDALGEKIERLQDTMSDAESNNQECQAAEGE